MTPADQKRLLEIEQRAEKATPGPWTGCKGSGKEKGDCACGMVWAPATDNHVLTAHDKWGDGPDMIYGANGPDAMRANAKLSAHARADIPWLVAKVRDLSAELDDMKEAVRSGGRYWGDEADDDRR